MVWPGSAGLSHAQFGVAAFVQRHFDVGPGSGVVHVAASGGCFPSLCLATGADVAEVWKRWSKTLNDAFASNPLSAAGWGLYPVVRKFTDDELGRVAERRAGGNVEAVVRRLRNNFAVGITVIDPTYRLKPCLLRGDWRDGDDVVGACVASSFIPVLYSPLPRIVHRGRAAWDGGIAASSPRVKPGTRAAADLGIAETTPALEVDPREWAPEIASGSDGFRNWLMGGDEARAERMFTAGWRAAERRRDVIGTMLLPGDGGQQSRL